MIVGAIDIGALCKRFTSVPHAVWRSSDGLEITTHLPHRKCNLRLTTYDSYTLGPQPDSSDESSEHVHGNLCYPNSHASYCCNSDYVSLRNVLASLNSPGRA